MGAVFNTVFSVLLMVSEFIGTSYAIVQVLFAQFMQSQCLLCKDDTFLYFDTRRTQT